MKSINKAILVGNVGDDPVIRNTSNGTTVANVRVATNSSYKDSSNGERVVTTEWHTVVFFGALAEIVEKYVTKGTKVYVEGPLQTRSWEDNDGNTRYSTQVNVRELVLLGGPNVGPRKTNGSTVEDVELVELSGTVGGDAAPDDDLPF